ncbi:hypothetical protein JHK86_024787 [Glycine max]|nr:hypothetical protein JHK86_024787 [Glycine max]
MVLNYDFVLLFPVFRGSKIGATLWQELFTELWDKLHCGSSYLIQNLRIVDNQSEYRVSPVPFLLTKSSLMLHGVMTVVLTVPPHLIHRKMAQLVILAKIV